MAKSVKFNDTELNSGDYGVRSVNHDQTPDFNLNIIQPIKEDYAILGSKAYNTKEITIEGTVRGSSQSAFEQNLSELKELLYTPDGILETEYGIRNALNFNGISQYVDCGDINNADGISQISISFWVKSSNWKDNKGLLSKFESSSARSWQIITRSANTFQFHANITGVEYVAYSGNLSPSNNIWYFVTAVYDNSNMVLYVNGIRYGDATSVSGSIDNTSSAVQFGRYYSTNESFDGSLCDIRIYNTALTAAQVLSLYNGDDITTGLVAHWPMNEGGGIKVYDNSGNGNTGKIYGATWTQFESGLKNYRKYNVILKSFSIAREFYDVSKANYIAKFLVKEGYGYANDTIQTLTGNIASDTQTTWIVEMDGTITPLPNTSFVLDACSALGDVSITAGGQTLSIGTEWSAGDTIIIDNNNKDVSRNNSRIDYSGAFPEFVIGNNTIQVDCATRLEIDAFSPVNDLLYKGVLDETNDLRAQSFKPFKTGNFQILDCIGIESYGKPTPLTIRIETDNSNKPSGSLVDANATATLNYNDVYSNSYDFKANNPIRINRITFPNAFSLTRGTKYWIVYRCTVAADSNNEYYVAINQTGTDYIYGDYASSVDSGVNWNIDTAKDLGFILYRSMSANWDIDVKQNYQKRYL